MVDEPGGALSGHLRWKLNRAFDDYVRTKTSDGSVEMSEGVTRREGEFIFPLDPRLSTPGRLVFRGVVEYRAHLGVLKVRFGSVEMTFNADGAALSIADPHGLPGDRLTVVTDVRTSSLAGEATDVLAVLAAGGSDLFMGKYEVGTILDPMRIELFEEEAP